jgi:predicted nucleic acid-binding protein
MLSADTNVFVYLFDGAHAEKQRTARSVVARLMDLDAALPLQVVGEFQNVLRRKLGVPVWLAAQEGRNLLEAFDSLLPSRKAAEQALALMAAGRCSYWDGLLVACCAEAGVRTLLSEDLRDGADIFGVHIVNPFSSAGGLSDTAREVLDLQ